MRKGKSTKEQEEENARILSEFVSSEDPELIYELTEILGKGSHGVVYKAINRLNGSLAAVKKLPSILQSDNFVSSCREIKILKELNSPYCIDFYNSYLKNGDLWIAMEYFDAGSLGDLLAIRKKGFNEYQIQMIIAQVLRGLQYLHSLNLIHRDIKAGNILLNKKGQVKLADFGISAFLDADETRRRTQIGSPFWMSPELILGEGYSYKTDIWSLGITILEMTEVEHTFFEQNPLTAVFQIVSDKPPQFSNLNAWSPNLRNFLSACLVKDVKDRPGPVDLLEHPFLSKEALREGAAIFSGGEDVQPPPGSEPALQCAVSSAESVPCEEASAAAAGAAPATDDEEDGEPQRPPLIANPSKKKRTMEEEAMRTTNLLLAREYIDMLKNSGSAGLPKTGAVLSADVTEAIVRVYLQDRSYKSVRVTVENSAEDVTKTLRLKLGKEWASEYALYKFQNENERLVTPGTKVLEVMKQHNVANGPLIWIFKEMPDTEAFGDLAEVLPRLQADGTSVFTNKDAVDGLIKVLLKSRLSLVSALFSVAKRQDKKRQEKLVGALVRLFGHAQQLVPLFVRFGALEVAHTMSANNLFVEGSMTARLVSAYGKLAANNYLQVILTPILRRVYHLSEALELDPSRAEEVTIRSNTKNLMTLALIILDSIFDNINALPLVFRAICAKLHEIVSACFPARGASHLVLRSFLFVKFICPALVSPDAFGLTDFPPSRAAGRTLVLLSKIIAAIVTGTRFGRREPYMAPLNDFIQQQSNSDDLRTLLEAILDVDDVSRSPPRRKRREVPLESLLSLPPPSLHSPPLSPSNPRLLGSSPNSPGRFTRFHPSNSPGKDWKPAIGRGRRGPSNRHTAAPQKALPPTPPEPQPPRHTLNLDSADHATSASPAVASDQPQTLGSTVASAEDQELQQEAQQAARASNQHNAGSDSEIVLSEQEIEDAVNIIYSFLDDEDKFREVGVAMNVLPSPPWDPALEDAAASDPTARYGDKDLDAKAAKTAADGDSANLRRSRRISFWGKKVSRESYLGK